MKQQPRDRELLPTSTLPHSPPHHPLHQPKQQQQELSPLFNQPTNWYSFSHSHCLTPTHNTLSLDLPFSSSLLVCSFELIYPILSQASIPQLSMCGRVLYSSQPHDLTERDSDIFVRVTKHVCEGDYLVLEVSYQSTNLMQWELERRMKCSEHG